MSVEQQSGETPEQLVLPAAKGTHHYIMGPIETAIFLDHSGKTGPKGEALTMGHCQILNPADLNKAFGLTG